MALVHPVEAHAQPPDEEPEAGEGGSAGGTEPEETTSEPDSPAEEPAEEGPSEPAEPADPPDEPPGEEATGAAGAAAEPAGAAGDAKPEQADGAAKTPPAPEPEAHRGTFSFGSYGRVTAAGDVRGRPGRNADVVAHGSRLDHNNYVELELRRDDHWAAVEADTRFVATLAVGNPVFHYDGEFDAGIAVRNLYMEERHLGLKNLSFWAGSRMLRGDDIYLFDFWPLDNLNTLGAGLGYEAESHTKVRVHVGLGQPNNPFYKQQVERAAPLNQFGTATVAILDRLRFIASAKVEQQVLFDGGAGLKFAVYGEGHSVPSGDRETAVARDLEEVPADGGWVIGGQFGGFTGERDTHVNIFFRYASGLAAYGEFATPHGLGPDRTASDASELLIAMGGNWEFGPATVLLGAYIRSFRNASEDLDFGDVDEGIVMARPSVFFTDWLGLAVEGSFQAQQRGVLADVGEQESELGSTNPEPVIAHVSRIGVVPFVTPAGRGSFSRPIFWVIYVASFRDDAARALYPLNDPFNIREIEHFAGVGAEWWFGSTSYGEQ
ncbi:MAG: carbohydrate porin [Deltaproteobacteria bacterium]|nr:carbohydrate porin [Deltaproteobacteria bacterium]